jgi:protease-4
VRIDGSLIDGKTIAIPGIGVRFIGDRTVVEILDRLRTDSSVAAVVLEIDSGGGSAVASDNIWRAAMRVRGVKPVVAAIGGIGASGAYYVASAAREIFVLPATLTGSIGIFYGKADVGDLLLSLGVNTFEEQRGARATMESWSRPYTEDEIAVLEEKIAFYYGQFLDRVAQGRAGKLTREEVDAAGQGRIWSGVRAVELGLADRVGGLGEAIARARALAGLPDDAPAVDAEPPKGGLVDILLGALTAADDAPAAEGSADLLPFVLRAVDLDGTLAALAPFLALDAATPMALLPYVLEADVE